MKFYLGKEMILEKIELTQDKEMFVMTKDGYILEESIFNNVFEKLHKTYIEKYIGETSDKTMGKVYFKGWTRENIRKFLLCFGLSNLYVIKEMFFDIEGKDVIDKIIMEEMREIDSKNIEEEIKTKYDSKIEDIKIG